MQAAFQLTRVWRDICPNGQPYPVDCRMLAEALKIKVHGEPIDDDFEAQLRIRGKRRVIIYNENIREEGRKNFCISHELGHHSCHTDKEEFFCTSKDLNDLAPHPLNVEQEANLFAATLLMPADDFRVQMNGQPKTLATISRLADERYKTTLTATCTRLIELAPTQALGMVIVKQGRVVRWRGSEEMKWTGFGFKSNHPVPEAGLFHNPQGEIVDSAVWLNQKNASRWRLTQSAVHMPYYDQTLVLLRAERVADEEETGETEPTSQSELKFR